MQTAFLDPLWLGLTAILFVTLARLTWIDLRTFRLPDIYTLPLIAAGIAAAILRGEGVLLHALGALFGYLALVAIELLYKHFRGHDGLGRGDAKLLAAGGAWCGALALPSILLAASFAALATILMLQLSGQKITRQSAIAFGPFLAFGIGLIWLVQHAVPGFAALY